MISRRTFCRTAALGAAILAVPSARGQRVRRILARTASAVPWSPRSLPGLVAWYSASDGPCTDTVMATPATQTGDAIAAWRDLSGNGNHLTQSTSAVRPTLALNELNGRPAVSFVAASLQWMRTAAAIARPTDHTIVALIKSDLTAQNCVCSAYGGTAATHYYQILAKDTSRGNGSVVYYVADGSALYAPYVTQVELSNVWTLFTAIWTDGAAAPCALRINGGTAANQTLTPVTTTHCAGASNVLCFGRNGVNGTIYGTFRLAELYICNRSLT